MENNQKELRDILANQSMILKKLDTIGSSIIKMKDSESLVPQKEFLRNEVKFCQPKYDCSNYEIEQSKAMNRDFHSDMEEKLASAKEKDKAMENELANAKKEIESLKSQLGTEKKESALLKQGKEETERKLQECVKEKEELENKANAVAISLAEAQTKLLDVEKQSSDIEKAKESLEVQVKETNNTIALDEEKLADMEKKLSASENEKIDLQAQFCEVEEENANLKAKLANAENQIKDVKQEKMAQEKISADLQDKINKIRPELEHYENMRKPYEAMYKVFLDLPSDMRENLKGILRGRNVDEFIFVGMQEENIGRLWDFCANEAKNKSSYLESLTELFWFFFDKCQLLHEEPMFERSSIKVGDKFDGDIAVRDADSAVLGCVDKVLFLGYNRCIGHKNVKKSIVHIKKI